MFSFRNKLTENTEALIEYMCTFFVYHVSRGFYLDLDYDNVNGHKHNIKFFKIRIPSVIWLNIPSETPITQQHIITYICRIKKK